MTALNYSRGLGQAFESLRSTLYLVIHLLSDNYVLHQRPEWALALLGSTDEKELSPSN